MLRALRNLGEILGAPPLHDEVSADVLVILEFDAAGAYKEPTLAAFKEDDVPLYLYKKAKGSNPPTLTPTLILTDVKRSLGNMRKAFNRLAKVQKNLPELELADRGKLEDMQREVEDVIAGMTKKKVLLTVRIDGKFLGEIGAFRDALSKALVEEGRESQSEGICAVCGQTKGVSGDISPFKFYTIDKPGFIVGGFDKRAAYKAFPLCYECRDFIRAARAHVERNLKFSLVQGKSEYLLIPDFIIGKEHVQKEVLDILTADRPHPADRVYQLTRPEKRRLTEDEREILDLLSKEKDVMAMHFLFLRARKGQTSEEKIELYVQDVYPSRLRALFDAKYAVERLFYSSGREFTYTTLAKFFADEDDKEFYTVVDRTFRGAALDEAYLVKFFIDRVRQEIADPSFREEKKTYRNLIRDAAASFMFVLLTTKKEVNVSKSLKEARDLEEVFAALPVLDNEVKQGLFLLGALVEHLLRVQYRDRDAAPFWKTLRGLRMDQRHILSLLPKVRAKLEEYEGFGPRERKMFQIICEHIGASRLPWNMSIDEINFYFSMGLGLFDDIQGVFQSEKRKEGAHEENREQSA